MTDINDALKQFGITESNLDSLDEIWREMCQLVPSGPFRDASSPECLRHEDLYREFEGIASVMPSIDGYKFKCELHDFDSIGQCRVQVLEANLDADEEFSIEKSMFEQSDYLRDYRRKFNAKRIELLKSGIDLSVKQIDLLLKSLDAKHDFEKLTPGDPVEGEDWVQLKKQVQLMIVYMGSSVTPPSRWGDLLRHLRFGEIHDLNDIINHDWPDCKESLEDRIQKILGPLGIPVDDLSELVDSGTTGAVSVKLDWKSLTPNDFERLVFNILNIDSEFQSVQWLTNANAPDGGRDISAERVISDSMSDSRTNRIIIQCKHWQSRSVALSDISDFLTQMELWEPPVVDEVIVATSGRFTTDAVRYVEKNNKDRKIPRIHMWAESRLEALLATKPGLIANFSLR